MDVYDSYCLWTFSSKLIVNTGILCRVRVRGLRVNYDEVERLFRVIERKNFASLPSNIGHDVVLARV